MSMLIIGFIVIVIIFGAAAAFLYSGTSGVVGLGRVTAVGSAGGVLGSITMVFSDAWQVITASLYGHLGMYGWILIAGIGLCIGVWITNAVNDAGKNKPISFVK